MMDCESRFHAREVAQRKEVDRIETVEPINLRHTGQFGREMDLIWQSGGWPFVCELECS